MDKKHIKKPLAAAMGAAFAVTLSAAPVANAEVSPFGMSELHSGYMQVAAEGNCGGKKAAPMEGNCGEGKKAKEGNCGEGKKAKEGNCGEGKKKPMEGNCGEGKKKPMEGQCGEGKK
jgi:uncharacterized low-complexity protein